MRRVLFWIIGILLLLLVIFLIWKALNRAPEAVADNFTTAYETAVSNNVATNDTDPNGDALTVSLPQLSGPTSGILTLDPSGTFTYTPNAGYSGTDQFGYQICDPGGKCDDAIVTITITGPPPISPDAVDDMFETMKNTAVTGNLLTNDIGTNLVVNPAPTPGLVVQPNGDFTYTPAADFSGTTTFSYEACDPTPLCDAATVTIVVFDFQLVPDSYTTTKNTAVSENVLDNDITMSTLTVSTTLTITPTNGIAEIQSDGKFTYTPNLDYEGNDSFIYQACNATSNCETAVVSITVGGPQPQPDNFKTNINEPVSGNVLDNDLGDGLNVTNMTVITPTNGVVMDDGDGKFTYTPNTDFEGIDMFTYEACDSSNRCATEKVTIEVATITTLTHTVVYGEWLLQIARCYGTTAYAIRAHNYIPYPDIIYPGQPLTIPNVGSVGSYDGPPCIQKYEVKTGDTLAEIAAAHNITESELARVNGLYTYHYYGYGHYYYGYGHHYYYYKGIYAGQKLIVPKPVPDYMQPTP